MKSISLFGSRLHRIPCLFRFFRPMCSGSDTNENLFGCIEEPFNRMWRDFDVHSDFGEQIDPANYDKASRFFSSRQYFVENARRDASRVLEILLQDGPCFDAKLGLNELGVNVSGVLVREVLLGVLKLTCDANKSRCAKLGYKFFVWSGQRENYQHTTSSYNTLMKLFADCEEFKAMWRIFDEMIEKGFPATARTYTILICSCGDAGLAKKVVERFIKSKTFIYRPLKQSFNAILLSLIAIKQYRLIEWVYEQMQHQGHSPNVLTYNILMHAQHRLGSDKGFQTLLEEMLGNHVSPDMYTFNICLHTLGLKDRPHEARNLLEYMKYQGVDPNVLHFTTLIDGLSRAGNLEACKYFFDEMIKSECTPDVVCYTVMITGYIAAGELEKAQEVFDDMILKGQLPNVYTYNSMIQGLCMANKYKEAMSMLSEMESQGCNPNYLVYNTLVSSLRNAGKLSEAHEVIRCMLEKGKYVHMLSKFKRYRRSEQP